MKNTDFKTLGPEDKLLSQDSTKATTMPNILKADLFRLSKHKSLWIAGIIMFGLLFLIYCTFWISIGVSKAAEEAGDIVLMEDFFLSLGRTTLAGFSDFSMMTLLVAIITCIFVGKEFSNGTIRSLVSRGANRVRLYFSKWISLTLLILVYSVCAILVCGIFTAFGGYGIEFTAKQFGLLMRAFALQTLCNVSTMSLVLALCFLCRSSGSSLGATIGIDIGLSTLISIIVVVCSISEADTSWIYFMPLQQMQLAISLEKLSTVQICAAVIMPIVYGVIGTVIGVCTFAKRDIK